MIFNLPQFRSIILLLCLTLSSVVYSQTLQVSGNGNVISNGDVTPNVSDDTDYGNVNIGSSLGHIFELKEIANSNMNGVTVTITGSTDFSPTSTSIGQIKKNKTANPIITFTPSSPGIKTATVTVTSADGSNTPYTFTVQGNGIIPPPEIDVTGLGNSILDNDATPDAVDDTEFGNVGTGSTLDHTFTIENTGNPSTTLNLNGSPIVSISGASEFTIFTQPSATAILGGNSLTFVVRFSPTVAATLTAIISIDNDDSDEDPYTFTVQGTGVVPIAEIDIVDSTANVITDGSVDSPSLVNSTDFGSTDITNPIAIIYTIENTGTANLIVTSVTSNNADFVVTTAPAGTVSAGSSTTFTITYTPSSIATTSATITVINSDGDENPYTFTVQGTGTETPVIAAGGLWSYLDDGSDQGTVWRNNTDYLTVPWATGNAELGYNNANTVTTVSYGPDSSNKYITTYFRKSFTISASDAANATLVMNAIVDDGMVVYIDGVEVWRDNMPTGIISYTTFSSSIISGVAETTWIQLKIINTLSAGSHEIAVEIHQRDETSSDLGFNFEMYTDNSYVFIPPPAPDHDGDGVANYVDSDDDNDGIPDVTEGCYTANFAALNSLGGEEDIVADFPILNHPLDDGNQVNMSITGTFGGITSYLAGEHDWAVRFKGPDTQGTFTMDFATDVDDLFFKLVDFDENETWTVDAYDDTNTLIDLTISNNVYHIGTYIDQAGNTFNDKYLGTGGNNNGDIFASDIYGSVYFYFPNTSISKIVFTIDQPDGSTVRLAAMHFCGLDTDGDGIDDYFDLDSDNDAIPDIVEAGGFDTDGNGKIDDLTDTDGDGLADTYDTTPAVYFAYEVTSIQDYDFDGDGIPNRIDLDADGDGIVDLREVGLPDADGNGMIDGFTDTNYDGYHDPFDGAGSQLITGSDGDSDGIPDTYPNANLDGTGRPNFSDIDSDDDGITDNTEAQPTGSYIALVTTDTDGDGIADVFDASGSFGGAGITPEDTDGDGTPDYLDLDSDNSEEPDAIEGHDTDGDGIADASSNANTGLPTGFDIDNDGLDDGYDNNTSTYDPTNVGLKAISHPIFDVGSDRDWRWSQVALDFDGTDDHIDYGDESSFEFSSDFTLEAWVLQETNVSVGTIISKNKASSTSGNRRGYCLAIIENSGSAYPNLTWYNNSGEEKVNITSSDPITNNRWYHIAANYDGTTAKLYIDGIMAVSDTPDSGPNYDDEKFMIGATFDGDNIASPKNYFNGFIDEVRIWNVALSPTQMHEMMNQEIEQNGTAVRGKVIPRDISGGLLWANLEGYYDMNDDDADDKSSNSKHGSPKNITTLQEQTAPLPYTTIRDGDWEDNTALTPWTLGDSVWDEPNGNGVDGSRIDWNIVVTSHNVNVNRNVKLLGLVSESFVTDTSEENITDSKLTMGADGNSYELNISGYLKLDGKIDLENESQLVQGDDSWLDVDSSGYVERDQQGTENAFIYNYWSSPVSLRSTSANNVAFTVANVLRGGTDPTTPNFIDFGDAYAYADGTLDDPINISTYWIWKFVNQSNEYALWQHVREDSPLNVTEGYTMKGTSGASDITDEQNYVYRGKPNNGDLTHTTFPGTFDGAGNPFITLTGNPYPSALDADAFINDNISSIGGGSDGITGTLYFWEHWSDNTHYLASYQGGYAMYTIGGGVAATSHPDIDQGGTGSKTPGRFIPVAQGFFVTQQHVDDGSGNLSSPSSGSVIFKNSQRVFEVENGNTDSVFTRAEVSKDDLDSPVEQNTPEFLHVRKRIWLGFESPTGFHRQVLAAFLSGASDAIDRGYEGRMIDQLPNDAYFIQEHQPFSIVAFENFDEEREIPISIIINEDNDGGTQKIMIDNLDNIEDDVNIYIKDNVTNVYYDLRKDVCEIQLASGTHEDRFSLVFRVQESLSVDDEEILKDNLTVFMNNAASEIQIRNNGDAVVEKIILYNSLGQTMNIWKENNFKTEINLQVSKLATGVYIVNLKTDKGLVTKKVIIE